MKDCACLQLMELDLDSENKGTIIAGLYVELFVNQPWGKQVVCLVSE